MITSRNILGSQSDLSAWALEFIERFKGQQCGSEESHPGQWGLAVAIRDAGVAGFCTSVTQDVLGQYWIDGKVTRTDGERYAHVLPGRWYRP